MENGLSVTFRKLLYKDELKRLIGREDARLRLNSSNAPKIAGKVYTQRELTNKRMQDMCTEN